MCRVWQKIESCCIIKITEIGRQKYKNAIVTYVPKDGAGDEKMYKMTQKGVRFLKKYDCFGKRIIEKGGHMYKMHKYRKYKMDDMHKNNFFGEQNGKLVWNLLFIKATKNN